MKLRNKLISIMLVLALGMSITACGKDASDADAAAAEKAKPAQEEESKSEGEFPFTLKTQDDIEVTFTHVPERVIAANACTGDELMAMGLGDKIIGRAYTNSKINPKWNDEYLKIPELAESAPSLEAILAEEPDFIYGRSSAFSEKNNTEQISISNFIENETEDEKDNTKIKVYITGEVKNQGVIELEEGDRIADAIEKAGGQTEQASLKNVNLAYQLEDGQKIYIPNINDTETEIIDDGASGVVDDATIKQTVVNINKADEKELQSLNGIGESLATSIVQYRKENGKFETIEDLKNVPGIGDSKFENIKEYIKVK